MRDPVLAPKLLQLMPRGQERFEATVAFHHRNRLSPVAREELVQLLLDRTADAPAQALLEDNVQRAPSEVEPRLRLAEHHLAFDRLPEAIEATLAATRLCPSDDEVWEKLGRLRHRNGELELALEAFERSLALNPARNEVAGYLELLQQETRFEDEYREDAAAAIERAKAIPLDTDVAVRVLLDLSVIRVAEDGRAKRFVQRVARIENREGIEQNQTQRVVYAAGEERMAFRRAAVVRKERQTIESEVTEQSGSGSGEFAQYRYASVELSPLRVGDCFVLEYRLDDTRQSFFGDYFGHAHAFDGLLPIERSRFVLITPRERTLHFNAQRFTGKPTVTEAEEGKALAREWVLGPSERIRREPGMPPLTELAKRVEVSSFQDWDAFTRWYWSLIKKQFETSPALETKIQELVAGKETREEKIRAIYDFVVTDIRYNDKWEFGIHGFKPFSAKAIFERRFGDCKDKATLIATMLQQVDIECWPVLIRGEARRFDEDLSLPLMNHFNHCIAYVPPETGEGPGWFLDGTAEHHPAHLLPSMDYGAKVLIVKPTGAELQTIGFPKPLTENGVTERHTVKVSADARGPGPIPVRQPGAANPPA
jgi:tetratricopeptide (TPR) repeat protein